MQLRFHMRQDLYKDSANAAAANKMFMQLRGVVYVFSF